MPIAAPILRLGQDSACPEEGAIPLTRQRPQPEKPTLATRRERRLAERQARATQPRARTVAPRPPVWRSPFVIVSALAVVLMIGVIAVVNLTSPRPGGDGGLVRPPASNAAQYADGGTIGDAGAPVVLEVYSDYQCPVCGRFGRDYLPSLVNEFVPDGRLRIEERTIAILGTGDSNESLLAGVAASAAGRQGRYWQFHDFLMYNQSGENRGAFSRDRLLEMADEIGLDRARFEADLNDETLRDEIRQRTNEARAAGIDRTPTFVLNGEHIVGLPRTYEDLATRIRQLAAQASPSPTPAGS